jgi:uncharacterized protein YwqG
MAEREQPDASAPPPPNPFERPAWLPVTEEGDGAAADSKFAGTPFLPGGEGWPLCPNCDLPMQLFVQLNLGQLPEAVRDEYGAGLIQLFYCTSDEEGCEHVCDAWQPFAESVVARLVPAEHGAARPASAEVENALPPRRVVGWREVVDYPDDEEGEALGAELDDASWQAMWVGGATRAGDKLAGWPLWVQGVEYPDCPECGRAMRLVFQIDSNDNLPYLFSDMGTGHITQCPEHKEVLAFGWACT